MIEGIEENIINLRKNKPLILNLTNYVTMDFMANALLAIGAAPIMSTCQEELEELVAMAMAININIGTLDNAFIEKSLMAAELAQKYQKPLILDPVGAGATRIRTKTARDLIPFATIVRGNASEIIALSGISSNTKGVESVNTTDDAKNAAIALANFHQCTIVVSGAIDFITDKTSTTEVAYGSELMPLVTGMGCAMTAIISAFRAVVNDSFEASNLATHYFNLCGELTALNDRHPASFQAHFIDHLHAADFDKIKMLYEAT